MSELFELCDSISGNLSRIATGITRGDNKLDELVGFNLLLVEVTAVDPRFAGTDQGLVFESQALALAIHGTGRSETADVLAHPDHTEVAVIAKLGFEDWYDIKLVRSCYEDTYETIANATGVWGLCK